MEHTEKAKQTTPHQMILQNRNLAELSGVSDVDSFDDAVVVAYTELGELTIRGKGLHVRRLNVDGGSLSIEGHIDTLSYSDVTRGGFFHRLLR